MDKRNLCLSLILMPHGLIKSTHTFEQLTMFDNILNVSLLHRPPYYVCKPYSMCAYYLWKTTHLGQRSTLNWMKSSARGTLLNIFA